jgi:hypothetical protein
MRDLPYLPLIAGVVLLGTGACERKAHASQAGCASP